MKDKTTHTTTTNARSTQYLQVKDDRSEVEKAASQVRIGIRECGEKISGGLGTFGFLLFVGLTFVALAI